MSEDRPRLLAQYLGKITRNLALNCWRDNRTEKRGGGEQPLVLDKYPHGYPVFFALRAGIRLAPNDKVWYTLA